MKPDMEDRGLFAIKPAAADGAFAADNQDRHWLDKAMVLGSGLSDVARERACAGVLFLHSAIGQK